MLFEDINDVCCNLLVNRKIVIGDNLIELNIVMNTKNGLSFWKHIKILSNQYVTIFNSAVKYSFCYDKMFNTALPNATNTTSIQRND